MGGEAPPIGVSMHVRVAFFIYEAILAAAHKRNSINNGRKLHKYWGFSVAVLFSGIASFLYSFSSLFFLFFLLPSSVSLLCWMCLIRVSLMMGFGPTILYIQACVPYFRSLDYSEFTLFPRLCLLVMSLRHRLYFPSSR